MIAVCWLQWLLSLGPECSKSIEDSQANNGSGLERKGYNDKKDIGYFEGEGANLLT